MNKIYKVRIESPDEMREKYLGKVFKAKGGTRTAYWLVISVHPARQSLTCIGLDAEGRAVSGANYYAARFYGEEPMAVMEPRELVIKTVPYKKEDGGCDGADESIPGDGCSVH